MVFLYRDFQKAKKNRPASWTVSPSFPTAWQHLLQALFPLGGIAPAKNHYTIA